VTTKQVAEGLRPLLEWPVEHVLATQTLTQAKPRTMSVEVNGTLPDGVVAKDVILSIIRHIGVGGGIVERALLAGHERTRAPGTVTLIGLGFGGWIAAEMATMAPRAFRRLVLVGAMGLKPERGEIADQALLSYIDYVRRGFADQGAFDRIFGAEPPTSQLEQWDLNREMTFRIAWKPYMYNPTLPHLLGGVATPALVVWGRDDRIVPLECGERYAKALADARLEIVEGAGHFVDMEKPDELARLVTRFASEA